MCMEEVRDIEIEKVRNFKELMKAFDNAGFQARNLFIGYQILKEMLEDKKCKRFFSFHSKPCFNWLKRVI